MPWFTILWGAADLCALAFFWACVGMEGGHDE